LKESAFLVLCRGSSPGEKAIKKTRAGKKWILEEGKISEYLGRKLKREKERNRVTPVLKFKTQIENRTGSKTNDYISGSRRGRGETVILKL